MKRYFILLLMLFCSINLYSEYYSLYGWGYNVDGQLGDGTTTDRHSANQIGSSNVWKSVICGGGHTVAIKNDGTLWTWGDNEFGQLGDGTTTDRHSPVQIGTDTNWVSVSCGGGHTIGIKNDGTLWAWGSNTKGQLGDETTTDKNNPTQIGSSTDWAFVNCGGWHTVAIKTDGTLWAWGYNYVGQLGDGTETDRHSPVQIGTDTNWLTVSCGVGHTIAIKSDGTLWAWGWNNNGQLGDGTDLLRRSPVQIGTYSHWLSVIGGEAYTFGIKSNGTLWAWGANDRGQLGDGTKFGQYAPMQIGKDENWVSVSCGKVHTMGIKNDSTLWAWGANEHGQLGLGDQTDRLSPQKIGSNHDWVSVTAGESGFSIALFNFLKAPTLKIPENNASIISLKTTVTWQKTKSASSYRVQLSTSSNFATTTVNTLLTDTLKSISGLSNNTKYYWRVLAMNSLDTSDWSSVWSFKTVTPTLKAPSNEVTNITLNPNLLWGVIANTTNYRIQVSTVSNFTNTIINSILADTIKSLTNLSVNTKYYWRVLAMNTKDTSSWSSVWCFTTKSLNPPTLKAPVNEATNVAQNPNLYWKTLVNATNYRVQVSIVSNFASTLINSIQTDTLKSLSGLSVGTKYYWRVLAMNSTDTSDWSAVWNFTTKSLNPPTLKSPANEAKNVVQNPNLYWRSLANATNYRIQVSTVSDFSSNIINSVLTDTLKSLSGLSPYTTYYWRVLAMNSTDTSDWSSVWSFRTKINPPSLASPSNNKTNISINPNIYWRILANATNYRIQVSTVSNFASTVINSIQTDTLKSISGLSVGTKYYWRVLAMNSTDTSDWSGVWNFTTKSLNPPTLKSPANDAKNVAQNPNLYWRTLTNATNYRIQVSTVSNFASTLINSIQTDTLKSLSALSIGTTYFWRVLAMNSTDTSDWSSVWSFSTKKHSVPSSWGYVETGNNATIIVDKTGANTFCDRAIATDDAIGFFYLDGTTEKCAGYSYWKDGENLGVVAWGDDEMTEVKDGFGENETYRIKMWDATLGKEVKAKGTVESGKIYYTVNGITEYSSIDAICTETHSLALAKGWNMISTYIQPTNDSIKVVLKPIVDNLVIAKNGAGLMYYPSKSIDLIKKWNVRQGYLVYMKDKDTVDITGMPLPKDSLLYLAKGWNMMAYTRKTEQAITTALAGIVSNIVIVKNGAGLMYYPAKDINLIGNMKPGAGYLIYMKSADTLDYPESNGKRTVDEPCKLPSHLIAKTNPYNMNLIVEANLPDDWEIGAYNADGVLVGSGLVENGRAAVTIFADDENTAEADGAVADEPVTFKAYNPRNDLYEDFNFAEIKNIISDKMLSEVNYTTNVVLTAKAVTELKAGEDYYVNIYPNPTKNKIELQINISSGTDADVKVYDLQGNELMQVFTGNLPQGETKLQINCETLPNGTYNVVINTKDKSFAKRFVVAR